MRAFQWRRLYYRGFIFTWKLCGTVATREKGKSGMGFIDGISQTVLSSKLIMYFGYFDKSSHLAPSWV